MRGSAPEITRSHGQLRVEARNAAAALAAVTEELGTSARIVAVDRVVRGGIGGFFSRELIQVTADDPTAAPGDDASGDSGDDDGQLGAPSAAVVEQTAAVVREHLAQRRGAAPSDPHDDLAVDAGAPHRDGPSDDAVGDVLPGARHDGPAERSQQGPSSFSDLLREASLAAPSPGAAAGQQYVRPQPVEVPQRRSPEMVGSPVAIALDRLLRAGDDADSFGEALRRELQRAGWDPRHGSPATSRIKRVWAGRQEASAPAATATAGDTDLGTAAEAPPSDADEAADVADVAADVADGADGADVAAGEAAALSVETLRAMGLPAELLAAVDGLPGDAKSAWIAAVAGSVAPLCTSLPVGDCIYVGPAAGELVAGSDVPVATMDRPAHLGGDIAVAADDSRAGRGDVDWLRDGRWTHLVVGGGSWRWHLMSEPRAVSWADVADLPTAVGVAFEHGVALGSPTVVPGGRAAADPDAVARALVDLAERGHGEADKR